MQAQKLISSNFKEPDDGPSRGGLYQECRKERFDTIADIKSLRSRLGYRIKRAPGVTVPQEIRRRLKHVGDVQSTGWLNRVWALRGHGAKVRTVKVVGKPRGRVIMNLNGVNPSIEITNETPGAEAFANKTGYFRRAVSNREQDMANYVHKKMLQVAQKSGFKVA